MFTRNSKLMYTIVLIWLVPFIEVASIEPEKCYDFYKLLSTNSDDTQWTYWNFYDKNNLDYQYLMPFFETKELLDNTRILFDSNEKSLTGLHSLEQPFSISHQCFKKYLDFRQNGHYESHNLNRDSSNKRNKKKKKVKHNHRSRTEDPNSPSYDKSTKGSVIPTNNKKYHTISPGRFDFCLKSARKNVDSYNAHVLFFYLTDIPSIPTISDEGNSFKKIIDNNAFTEITTSPRNEEFLIAINNGENYKAYADDRGVIIKYIYNNRFPDKTEHQSTKINYDGSFPIALEDFFDNDYELTFGSLDGDTVSLPTTLSPQKYNDVSAIFASPTTGTTRQQRIGLNYAFEPSSDRENVHNHKHCIYSTHSPLTKVSKNIVKLPSLQANGFNSPQNELNNIQPRATSASQPEVNAMLTPIPENMIIYPPVQSTPKNIHRATTNMKKLVVPKDSRSDIGFQSSDSSSHRWHELKHSLNDSNIKTDKNTTDIGIPSLENDSSNELEIKGNLYLAFGQHNIPAHFTQNANGIHIGLDGEVLCEKLNLFGEKLIFKLICNCVRYKNCTQKIT